MRGRPASLALAVLTAALAAYPAGTPQAAGRTLTVCADPGNLPYSDEAREGFGNRLATLIAKDLHASLRYVWAPERRGFLRRGFEAGCEMVTAVPPGLPGVRTTRPYLTSSYVIVRKRSLAAIASFDDPALRRLRIGLPLLGAEGINIPAAGSLAARGLSERVIGFPVWQFDSKQPQAALVAAVASGKVDIAILWGPFAGYFAKRYGTALAIDPVPDDPSRPDVPRAYEIAVGVRPDLEALRDEVDTVLARRAGAVQSMLAGYNVTFPPRPIGN